jgi:hypothetical protein
MPAIAGWYAHGARHVGDAGNLDGDAFKFMLVTPGYIFDPAHQFVDNGAGDSTDPSFNEIAADNYPGGFGGAGRLAATIAAGAVEPDADYAFWALSDVTWTTLGGSTNATVGALILIKEITNDGASLLIAYLGITNRATDGTDFVVNFPSASEGGSLRMQA